MMWKGFFATQFEMDNIYTKALTSNVCRQFIIQNIKIAMHRKEY